MKDELVKLTLDSFCSNFGTKEGITTVAVPASIILLGDHTHYNEGVILSVAIDRYAVASVKERDDDNLNIIFSDCELSYYSSLNQFSANNIQCGQISFGPLLGILREEKILQKGFNCMINSNIPSAIGLGGVTAHHMALLIAVNKALKLDLPEEEIINIARRGEMASIGKISNRAHHRTVVEAKKRMLFFNDLRKDSIDYVQLNNLNYKLLIYDTGKVIEDIRDTCNERISECKVGVDGLRLYIWGIKNLRDVNIDFLKRHIHMLPHRIYARVLYNVTERMRVENLLEVIAGGNTEILSTTIKDSHYSLRKDYEIGSETLDYLVTCSMSVEGVIASKMISCSANESIYSIVAADRAQEISATVKEAFYNKFGKELTTYSLDIINGCDCL